MTYALLILLDIIVLFAIWVRVAASNPKRWHVTVDATPKQMDGGVIMVTPGDSDTFKRLFDIAKATPRTRLLAGGADAGHATFITRSAVWGFPDYSTMQLHRAQNGDQIAIYARLRFGRKDFGVNSARVTDWLQRLHPTQSGSRKT